MSSTRRCTSQRHSESDSGCPSTASRSRNGNGSDTISRYGYSLRAGVHELVLGVRQSRLLPVVDAGHEQVIAGSARPECRDCPAPPDNRCRWRTGSRRPAPVPGRTLPARRATLPAGEPSGSCSSSATASSAPRSSTTRSAPRRSNAWRLPPRSMPTTRPKPPARPAATPAAASSTTMARAGLIPSVSAQARNASAAGLPGRPRSAASMPSILASNRPSMPARDRISRPCRLDVTTPIRTPRDRRSSMRDTVESKSATPSVSSAFSNTASLRRARPCTVRASGGSADLALRQLHVAGPQKIPHPVFPGLAVHVGAVVGALVERHEGSACSRARSRRKPSNSAFQAAECSRAVRVTTPSMSNTTAWKPGRVAAASFIEAPAGSRASARWSGWLLPWPVLAIF